MKKTIAFALAITLCLSFCMYVSASDAGYIYSYGDIEIVFAENSSFSEEMKQHTVEYIVNGDDGVATYNLLCTLFGHKEEVESVITISHKVSSYDPRCLRETWEVHACSRCNEALDMIEIGRSYITCCPEE